jgi:hypothetical protein
MAHVDLVHVAQRRTVQVLGQVLGQVPVPVLG